MVAFKHGLRTTPEYYSWISLRRRCANVDGVYPGYGGRGIKVCARWDDFLTFLADMGPRPSKQHSIDRINNDGDYEPSNCRWATRREQAANRRSPKMVTHNDETLCVAEWARRYGIESGVLARRLDRGQSLEQATSHKGNPRVKMLTLGGRTQSLAEWSADLGIKKNTLWGRVLKGWSDRQILTTPVASNPQIKKIKVIPERSQ